MKSDWAVVDVETTGLDAHTNALLEIAVAIVDPSDLTIRSTFHRVVYYSASEVADMRYEASPVVDSMHETTGLWGKVNGPNATQLWQVDQELVEFLARFGMPRTMPVVGNSVRLDMNFIDVHLPETSKYLDYHMRDVSTIAGLASDWYDLPWFEKHNDHTALKDVEECIRELRHYREAIFRTEDEQEVWRKGAAWHHEARTLRTQIGILLRRRAQKEAPNAAEALRFMAETIERAKDLPDVMLGEFPETERWVVRDKLTGARYPQPNKQIAEMVAQAHGNCEVIDS